jgi:hypothetical protein
VPRNRDKQFERAKGERAMSITMLHPGGREERRRGPEF